MAYIKTHIYTRVSKTSQQEGSGLDEQLRRIESYTTRESHLFNGSPIQYWQDIGLSAYGDANIQDGELASLLGEIANGTIGKGHALVIYSLDRLSRRSSWDEDTIQKIVKAGVDIHDVSTPVVLKADDSFSKIIMELIVARANNESKIKSERSLAGWNRRLQDTISNGVVLTKRLPFWIETDAYNKAVAIDEQVQIINTIFNDYVSGLSCPMIARKLNTTGFKTKSGKQWRSTTISKLIKDDRLQGNFRRSATSEPIPNIFPVVVSADVFEIANRIIKANASGIKGRPRENNKTREVNNIITGLVRCGQCGSKVTTSKNARGVRYVVCLHRRNHEVCTQKAIRLENLEKLTINNALGIDMNLVFSPKDTTSVISTEAKLKAELEALYVDLSDCKNKIAQRKEDKKRPSVALAETLTDIEDRIDEIENELSVLNVNEPIVDLGEHNLDELMCVSNTELRMSLRKYLVQVLDTVTFRTLDSDILIELKYNRDVYRHIIITDSKGQDVLNEISISKNNNTTQYKSRSVTVVENADNETIELIGNEPTITDVLLLINYISVIDGKEWIGDYLHGVLERLIENAS